MSMVGISDAYGGGPSVFDQPKLEPAYKDEKARVFIPAIEKIWMGYRHGIGGQRTGAAIFGGNWLCTGRDEVMRAQGTDPEACILCRLHTDPQMVCTTVGPTGQPIRNPVVTKATRKFVTQVFRYNTDPSGLQLILPFGARLLTWQFSDQEYRALGDLQRAWTDLRKYDLMLNGKDKNFKTWDVSILPQSYWLADPAHVNYIQQMYASAAIGDDLMALIGRKIETEAEVMSKVMEVLGGGSQGQGGIAPQYGQQMMPQMGFPGGGGYGQPQGQMMPQGMPPAAMPVQQMPDLAQPQPGMLPAPQGVGTPLVVPQQAPQMAPQGLPDLTGALTAPQPQQAPQGLVPPPGLPQMPGMAAPTLEVPQYQAPAPQMAPPPAPVAAPAPTLEVPQMAPLPQQFQAPTSGQPIPGAPPQQVDFNTLLQVPPPPPPG